MAFNILNIPTGTLLLTNGGFVGLGNSLSIENGEIKVTVDPSLILITIDNQLSTTSTNPVQNKVITNRLSFVESLVNGKADESNVYSKTQVDNLLGSYLTITDANQTYQAKGNYLTPSDITGKANVGDSYTKQESDAKYLTEHQDISGKANVGDSYTKAESDNKYLTEHQSLADYLTIQSAAQTYQPKGNYVVEQDLLPYLTKTEAESTYATYSTLEDYVTKNKLEEDELVISSSLNDLNLRVSDNFYTKSESDEKYATVSSLLEDERVIANSLNDLNQRLNNCYTKSEIDSTYVTVQDFEDSEFIAASALTDLDSRLQDAIRRIELLENN